MKSYFFWGIFALLISISSHFGYLLLLSHQNVFPKMILDGQGEIKRENEKDAYFGGEGTQEGPGLSYRICTLDLRQEDWIVAFNLQRFYWLVTLYAPRGRILYTLNNHQANQGKFVLLVKNTKMKRQNSFLEGNEDYFSAMMVAEVPDDKVIVVLRAALPFPEEMVSFAQNKGIMSCAPLRK